MIGRTISHYEVLSQLGAGGMGVVYKARDTRLDRLVALKFLPEEVDSDPVRRQRFVHEAKAASALNHPHIVTIYDTGEVDGRQFVAMELLEGQNLRQRIGGRPLAVDDVLDLGIQIADALEAAHGQGILHRDIKPDNIFVTARGHVKLLDFGLAKHVSREALNRPEDDTRTALTEFGTTVGTVAYMSPEQARSGPLNARSDLFSLGAVLYEMITGRQAFQGSSVAAVFDNVLNRQPPAVSESNPLAPAGLSAVIGKALQKDKEARYASAAELRADLEQLRHDPRSSLAAPRTAARRSLLALTVVAAPVLAGLALFWVFSALRERNTAPIGSIAVLPLANLSGDAQQEYFADGMTEALITELSKIRALKVISRTSAMRFKNGHQPAPQIARELGVDALIEGSVLRDGDQVRISVQLIDGGSDHHLWARSFDREMGGILALHSEVAQAIADEIRITLAPQERTRLGSDRAVNPKAYELYVLGRHHWNRRTIEDYWQAVKTFKQSLELDPAYAPTQAALAQTYMLLGEQGGMPQSEARMLAGTAITKAHELGPELAEVNTALGVWKLHYEWDWNGSQQALRRAIEINPGYAPAHQIYGRSLGFAGRFVEARREIEQAGEIDPLSSVVGAYRGQIDIFEGRYAEAIEHLRQSLELDSRHPLVLHSLGEAYLAQGQFADAVTWLERSIVDTDEPSSHFIAILGCAYARAGRMKDALAVLKRLQRREEQGLVSAFDTAALHLALGDKERALSSLEEGRKQRDLWMVELKAWPWFDSIERDPRYDALLRQIGFPN